MNWTASSSESIDQYINSNFYNQSSIADGIDLRIELNRILYGTATDNPKGHWIVLRKFNMNSKSDNYNECTHEGVGGPAYNYADIMVKTRRVPVGANSDSLYQTKAGVDIGDRYIYYFEYTIKPRLNDQIFELDWDNHLIKPPNSVNYLEKYTIKRSHPYRLENGRVEYYAVSAVFDEISY